MLLGWGVACALILLGLRINKQPKTTTYDRRKSDREVKKAIAAADRAVQHKLKLKLKGGIYE